METPPNQTRQKNIALLLPALNGGGAERVALSQCEGLQALGHCVRLFVLSPHHKILPPSHINLSIVDIQNPRGIRRIGHFRRGAKTLFKTISESFGGEPIDLLLSHLYLSDRYAQHIPIKNKYTVVHSSAAQTFFSGKGGKVQRYFRELKVKKRYQNLGMVFVSKAGKQEFEDHVPQHRKPRVVIYNPFNIEKIQALAAQPLNQELQTDYFLHVGRFCKEKRQDRMIEIYKRSKSDVPLYFLGTGTEKETKKLELLISDNNLSDRVFILPFVQNPFPIIAKARALMLCSDYEGLPNAIIEALICGTPAISFDMPTGPREILTGPLQKYLIEHKNIAQFADAINAIAANPTRISANDATISRFDETARLTDYLNLIEK